MKADTKYTIILKLLTAIAHLPLSALYHLSNFAYFVIYRLVRYRRDTVRSNLERVFGKDDEDRILQLEKGFYRHFCDCFVETVKLLHISDEEINERVNVTNGEYIDSIIRSGHPVVLFLGHYGNWEWVQAIIRHFSEPLIGGQIYAPLSDRVMDRVMLRIRSRFGLECIPQHKAVRRLIQIINDGQMFVIGFISDQRPGGAVLRHWTDFLGQDTPYATGGETIGNHVGANFVYLDVEKTSRGHYHMTLCPITPDPEDNEEFPYTREFFKMLEKTIYRAPQYWLWSHKRWLRQRN